MRKGKIIKSAEEVKEIINDNISVLDMFYQLFPVLFDDREYEKNRAKWFKRIENNKKILQWLDNIKVK